MSEPLTSNLVAELHAVANDLDQGVFGYPTYAESPRALVTGKIRLAADEIERLTAELQGTKDELYSVDKAAKELGAERDRLDKANILLHESSRKYVAENLRLRAALERISEYYGEDRAVPRVIAREALANRVSPVNEGSNDRAQPVKTKV